MHFPLLCVVFPDAINSNKGKAEKILSEFRSILLPQNPECWMIGMCHTSCNALFSNPTPSRTPLCRSRPYSITNSSWIAFPCPLLLSQLGYSSKGGLVSATPLQNIPIHI